MNQRAGKTHGTAASFAGADRNDRMLVNFFRSAKEQLIQAGSEDAAYYFEMIEDHLRGGGSLNESPAKILGL